MKADQYSSHINNYLPVIGSSDALPFAGDALPLVVVIQINGNNQHRSISLDPSRYINHGLYLAGAADSLPLAGSALPLAGVIRINGKYMHRAIHLDLVLKLHELDGKHNAEGIYHNKITPPVVSSIH